MQRTDRRALRAAATRAFEELGLLCVRDSEPDASTIGRSPEIMRVEFTGTRRGRLVLQVSGDVLDAVTANMLGTDGPHSDDVRTDALGELANVICGNVVPAYAGARATVVLAKPAPGPKPRTRPRARAVLALESGTAIVELFVRR